MNIICKFFGHKPDLIKLIDSEIDLSNKDTNYTTNCTRCNKLMTYDECWKHNSYKMVIILQNKLKTILKNK